MSLDQRGIDLFIEFRPATGQPVHRLDTRWHGLELLVLCPSAAGDYVLQVESIAATGTAGTYSLKINAPHPRQQGDERAKTAQNLATRLKELATQGTAAAQRDAVDLARQTTAAWREAGDRIGEAQAVNTLGFLLNALGQSKEAVQKYETALDLWQAAGDASGEAETLHNRAAARFALGDREKALADYERALPLRRAAGDRSGEGWTLGNLARLYQATGRSDEAIAALLQALELQRAAGNVPGEIQCLIGLGTLQAQRGDLQKGLDHFKDVLPLMKKGGDTRGLAYALTNSGKLYADLGQPEQGLRHLRDAAPLMRQVGDKRGEAMVLQRAGAILLARNEAAAALDDSGRALALAQEVNDPWAAALALTTMARAHYELGDRGRALDLGRRALQDLEALQDSHGTAAALHFLGVLHYREAGFQAAIEHFQRAVDSWKEDSPSRANSLFWLARAEYAEGHVDSARRHAGRALEIVEASRSGVAAEHLRASYIASRYHYYEFYIDVLMELHRAAAHDGWDARALEVSERARARTLVEALNRARDDIRHGIDPDLHAKETRLRREIGAVANRVAELLGGPARRDAEARLRGLLAELSGVEAEIGRRSPRFASLTQPVSLTLERIQRDVLDEGTILLEYALGDDRSYLWVAGADFLKSFELPSRAEIEKRTSALRRLLSRVEAQEEGPSWRREWQAVAGPLAAVVLAPAAKLLAGKRLLVVADGPLHYIPFEALPLDGSFLPNEMVRIPSAYTLLVSRTERARRARPAKPVAVFADPVYDPGDPRVQTIAAAGRRADGQRRYPPRLAFTRQEAQRIAAIVPGGGALIRVGFDANRSTAIDTTLRDFRIVHFAAHATIDETHPELSGLGLSSVDRRGRPRDGFLRLHEIYNLDLPADLVVLSACQSALGANVRGEGMVGLTRGFIYAGAAGVVASLWKVHDEATAELMELFYRNLLRRNLAPAAALHAARLELAGRRRWEHPFYWAGFTLIGDWR